MYMRISPVRAQVSSLLTALVMASGLMVGVTRPQAALSQTTPRHSFLHRHHRMAAAVGGIAAYRAAKHTGYNRTATGRHKNFAQRHPILSGVAGAAVTNHEIKKHTR